MVQNPKVKNKLKKIAEKVEILKTELKKCSMNVSKEIEPGSDLVDAVGGHVADVDDAIGARQHIGRDGRGQEAFVEQLLAFCALTADWYRLPP